MSNERNIILINRKLNFFFKKLKNGKNKRKDPNFDTCHLRKK